MNICVRNCVYRTILVMGVPKTKHTVLESNE